MLDLNGHKLYSTVDLDGSKTVPFGASHACLAYSTYLSSLYNEVPPRRLATILAIPIGHWYWVLVHVNENSFLYERLYARPHFEEEAKGFSEWPITCSLGA